jgi:hypothetical protein
VAIGVEDGGFVDANGLYGEAHYRPGKQFVVAWSVGALKLLLGGLGPVVGFGPRQKLLFWVGLALLWLVLRLSGHLRRCLLALRLRLRELRIRGFGLLPAHRLRLLLSFLLPLPPGSPEEEDEPYPSDSSSPEG